MARRKFIRGAQRIIASVGLVITAMSEHAKTVRIYCQHPTSGNLGHIDVLRTASPCPRALATIRANARTVARGTYLQAARGDHHVGA